MLCLDIKLVSRLRGVSFSSNAGSSSTSPTHSAASAASSPPATAASSAERSKGRRTKRDHGDHAAATISDSEEESLRPCYASVQEMIRRNRSRSVCVAAILPTSQHLRQLHRRASHHVYVTS